MRVIFHIGQQKTGTTAIQQALKGDRPRLQSMGILFPDTGHDRGLRGGKHANHNGFFLALWRGNSETQTLDEIRTELRQQIKDAQPHTVLISAESAFMAADRHENRPLDALDALLPGEKQIAVYLRRPDRFVSSFHQQMIRNGHRIAPLNTERRLDRLVTTCQLDYVRAVEEYATRYDPVQVFRYEDVGDSVTHFYRTVLGVEPPAERPAQANTSVPDVMVDLTREYTNAHGRMTWHQVQALVRFGQRERVDLIGADNRRRIREFFEPQNAKLGRYVGRDRFYDDLDDIAVVPVPSITPQEANERYRAIFDELMRLPSVYEVRRHCLELEAVGKYRAAAQVFAAHRDVLGQQDIDWFRRDLETATTGRFTIVANRYQATEPAAKVLARVADVLPMEPSWKQRAKVLAYRLHVLTPLQALHRRLFGRRQ